MKTLIRKLFKSRKSETAATLDSYLSAIDEQIKIADSLNSKYGRAN
ncbi:hypothetical protein CHCC14819_0487 [Bacillus licheniformis]|nr:hypothetical protein CHCC14819_0487 [Bacillus licheniformis]